MFLHCVLVGDIIMMEVKGILVIVVSNNKKEQERALLPEYMMQGFQHHNHIGRGRRKNEEFSHKKMN